MQISSAFLFESNTETARYLDSQLSKANKVIFKESSFVPVGFTHVHRAVHRAVLELYVFIVMNNFQFMDLQINIDLSSLNQ